MDRKIVNNRIIKKSKGYGYIKFSTLLGAFRALDLNDK